MRSRRHGHGLRSKPDLAAAVLRALLVWQSVGFHVLRLLLRRYGAAPCARSRPAAMNSRAARVASSNGLRRSREAI